MVLLDPDPFLNELTKLYECHRESGSVWVTLKHSSLKRKKKQAADQPENIEFRCLVRATDGKRNISTVLSPKDHERFQMAYATVLKAHMDALKKREKKYRKEKKSNAKSSTQ